jgi:hypothetical protein
MSRNRSSDGAQGKGSVEKYGCDSACLDAGCQEHNSDALRVNMASETARQ